MSKALLNRRGFVASSAGLIGAKLTAPYILHSTKKKKNFNILVITIDTLRWDHVGYNNRKVGWIKKKMKNIHTPNIDRLAKRSAIFDRHYIGSFPTIPQRTDCYTGNINFPRYDWKKLGPEEIIISELLQEAGYYTGLISDTKCMFTSKFNRGMNDAINIYRPPKKRPKPSKMPMPGPKENYRQESKQRNKQLSEMAHFKKEEDWWVVKTMTTAADWIKENGKRDKWFLWIDTYEVHEVWIPPKKYVDMYDPKFRGGIDYDFPNYASSDVYNDAELHHMWARYAGEVTLTDKWIGKVLDQLDEQNLWDNTIVVLQSDHGIHLGEHNLTGKHTIDKENPWPIYEEVGRVPHLVWTPFNKTSGRITALTQQVDLFPTLLEAAGIKGPKTYGCSYLPLLLGEDKHLWYAVFSSWFSPPDKDNFTVGRLTVTTYNWAYVARENGWPAELYDLRADPFQKKNAAKKYKDVVKDLQENVVYFMLSQQAEKAYVEKFM